MCLAQRVGQRSRATDGGEPSAGPSVDRESKSCRCPRPATARSVPRPAPARTLHALASRSEPDLVKPARPDLIAGAPELRIVSVLALHPECTENRLPAHAVSVLEGQQPRGDFGRDGANRGRMCRRQLPYGLVRVYFVSTAIPGARSPWLLTFAPVGRVTNLMVWSGCTSPRLPWPPGRMAARCRL
jgi:hypothetical protein